MREEGGRVQFQLRGNRSVKEKMHGCVVREVTTHSPVTLDLGGCTYRKAHIKNRYRVYIISNKILYIKISFKIKGH